MSLLVLALSSQVPRLAFLWSLSPPSQSLKGCKALSDWFLRHNPGVE